MIKRYLENQVVTLLSQFAAVAILGPRQVGKTTLAKNIAKNIFPEPLYLDLERPSDLLKLSEPELYLNKYEKQLVIIDEVQRLPGLFQILRSLIDERRDKGIKTQQFLVLGSASKDLLQQSSESLAGRIIYTELGGFTLQETHDFNRDPNLLWIRGGFPESYLSTSDDASMNWRESFIRTYIEREIPQLAQKIPGETLRRFWTMLAYNQGELLNATRLAAALGVSVPTIGRYLDILVDLFLIRILRPWSSNVGKRLVKTPKIYIRDSGIMHALLNLNSLEAVLGNSLVGNSWENFVIENILGSINKSITPWFYRTTAGAEIDLLLEKGSGEKIAIEIKRSLNPTPSKGFYIACQDLSPIKAYVVYPGTERYFLSPNVEAIPLLNFLWEYNSL